LKNIPGTVIEDHVKTSLPETTGLGQRIGLFFLFLLFGLVTFVPPFFLESVPDVIFQALVTGAFLLIALWLRKKRETSLFQITFAFFIASLAMLLNGLISLTGLNSNPTVFGTVLRQFISTLVIAGAIILLNRLAGNSLGSIYLQKGRLWLGLGIGLGFFILILALVLIDPTGVSSLFSIQENITYERVLALMPLVLVFVLLNGFREEILFRGLFLKKLGIFFGAWTSNFLLALIFASAHIESEYAPDLFVLLGISVIFGLVWGYVMQKTDSIIGPALFHAAFDIPVVLGVFSFI
jgi:membrane protease YdiL (CAAX protease family)